MNGRGLSRRAVIASGTAMVTSILAGCAGRFRRGSRGTSAGERASEQARLLARPAPPVAGDRSVGLQPLRLGAERDGLLFVPTRPNPEPLPLVVMLHGAGGDGPGGLAPLLGQAEEAGLILLAPESRGRTWDVIIDDYGPDVAFIDRALAQTFSRYAVDAERVSAAGFSDGATYALGLGLANGDLFRRVVAFSPGFAPRSRPEGRPSVYVSHGTGDTVLPIDRCSRRIVPELRERRYEVRYREFDGGHEIPTEIAEEAVTFLRGDA